LRVVIVEKKKEKEKEKKTLWKRILYKKDCWGASSWLRIYPLT